MCNHPFVINYEKGVLHLYVIIICVLRGESFTLVAPILNLVYVQCLYSLRVHTPVKARYPLINQLQGYDEHLS